MEIFYAIKKKKEIHYLSSIKYVKIAYLTKIIEINYRKEILKSRIFRNYIIYFTYNKKKKLRELTQSRVRVVSFFGGFLFTNEKS